MENNPEENNFWFPHCAFRMFVCASLTALLGVHVYSNVWKPQGLEDNFSNMKYVVMRLDRGLSQALRRQERLEANLERVASDKIPAVMAAAERARGALGPLRANKYDVSSYDRQVADYALESAGARVLDTGDTVGHFVYEGPVNWALHMLTAFACHECQSARAIIQPGTLPGECWAFKGRGEAVIRLLGTVVITGFTVEHIPSHIDPTREILSAPRKIQLQGLRSRSDLSPHDFGTVEYNKNGNPIQYFDVKWSTNQGFNLVRVKVLSNWGHPVYTCVYRIRVHGDLVPGQAPSALSNEDPLTDTRNE